MAQPTLLLLTESFQQMAVGTYAIGDWKYAEGSPWLPDDYVPTPVVANLPINTCASDGSPVAGSWFFSRIYSRTGRAAWSAFLPGPTNPYGKLTNGVVGADVGGVVITPIGFSVVPCPERPGRKRLALPGKKMLGRGSVGSDRTPPCDLSLQWFFGNPLSRPSNSTVTLSFVVRFPRRTNTENVKVAWLMGVGRADTKPQYFSVSEEYSTYSMGAGSSTDCLVFGCSNHLYTGSSGGAFNSTITPPAAQSLPWLFFGSVILNQNVAVPAPSVPGQSGNFYKFEFDRDYHIEVCMTPTADTASAALNGATKFALKIDGESQFSGWVTSSQANDGSAPQAETVFRGSIPNSFAFNFHNLFAENAAITPEQIESVGKILISDIVFGRTSTISTEAYYGPSTRVWGETPNTDVKVQFRRPSGGSNAAIVGATMSSSAVDPTRELKGGPGQQDTYKTEGSSLPDFAGAVIGVQTVSLVRTSGAPVSVWNTLNGEDQGSAIEILPSTAGNYTVVSSLGAVPSSSDPAVVADQPYGVKIKE